jgi:AraC-like DNA-binding protein
VPPAPHSRVRKLWRSPRTKIAGGTSKKHFRRLRALDEIAAERHVNNAYLCRLFRRYQHQSPYQFLLRLKLNFAASRLQTPGILIIQIAAELGFSDPFHFSRLFRSVHGLSPAAFRSLR